MSLPLLGGVTVLLVAVIYFVNIKPIIANTSLIDALVGIQTKSPETPDHLEKAYRTSRLGRPEAVEWIANSIGPVLQNEGITMDRRNEHYLFAAEAVSAITQELEGDPRYELLAGSFFRNIGQKELALAHLKRAKELMPEKQAIRLHLGQMLFESGSAAEALAELKEAYELAPENDEAKRIYEAVQNNVSSQ